MNMPSVIFSALPVLFQPFVKLTCIFRYLYVYNFVLLTGENISFTLLDACNKSVI